MINYKDNSKIDIEINKVPFKYRKIMDEICPVVTTGTILKKAMVVCHCIVS